MMMMMMMLMMMMMMVIMMMRMMMMESFDSSAKRNIFYECKMFSLTTFTPRFQTEMFSPLKCFSRNVYASFSSKNFSLPRLDQVKMCVVHYRELFL